MTKAKNMPPSVNPAPDSLPPIVAGEHAAQKILDANRTCNKCGKEGRVISNNLGVNVFCNTCKRTWPISTTPKKIDIPFTEGRGLRKMTYLEPDWDKVFD